MQLNVPDINKILLVKWEQMSTDPVWNLLWWPMCTVIGTLLKQNFFPEVRDVALKGVKLMK